MAQMITRFNDSCFPIHTLVTDPLSFQLAAAQELYTQYMAAYAEYMQLVSPTFSPPADGAPAPPTHHTFTPAPAPAPAPEAAPRHQMMNAGGGGAGGLMEDEPRAGGERDLLDWVYLSSRVMLLASVVYFYGSVARLVLVSCVAILLYFYQVSTTYNITMDGQCFNLGCISRPVTLVWETT